MLNMVLIGRRKREGNRKPQKNLKIMLLFTTYNINGKKIVQFLKSYMLYFLGKSCKLCH